MIRFISLLFLLALATVARAEPTLNFGPFQGVDLAILGPEQREIITQASTDFDLVLQGKKPKYAGVDPQDPLLQDGGTQFYLGKGYKLVVVKSLSTFGSNAEESLVGYVYGPVLQFPSTFAPGNSSTVESLRFYTPEQLKGLLASH